VLTIMVPEPFDGLEVRKAVLARNGKLGLGDYSVAVQVELPEDGVEDLLCTARVMFAVAFLGRLVVQPVDGLQLVRVEHTVLVKIVDLEKGLEVETR
jgi:hypothetical protein